MSAEVGKIRRVLVSVWDKDGLTELALCLAQHFRGVEFIASFGSYSFLSEALSKHGIDDCILTSVKEYTGKEEFPGGLVKTLEWKIFLGILADLDSKEHLDAMEACGAKPIDMVICNLYPYYELVHAKQADPESLRNMIDIGGSALLRAASKNYPRVAAVSSPKQYHHIIREIEKKGLVGTGMRFRLAHEAFAMSGKYDMELAKALSKISYSEDSEKQG